jgi:hypothetical protein
MYFLSNFFAELKQKKFLLKIRRHQGKLPHSVSLGDYGRFQPEYVGLMVQLMLCSNSLS